MHKERQDKRLNTGKNPIGFSAVCLVVLIAVCGIYVYADSAATVNNTFYTGVVDIELKEYQRNADGGEEEWIDNPIVVPGSKLSKIARVFNRGNDCYIRARMVFPGTDRLTADILCGMGDDWMKGTDGYYYYREILPAGESVDIFQGLRIPEVLNRTDAERQFSLDVQVEAVQSRNFLPDFRTGTPWGGLTADKADFYGRKTADIFHANACENFTLEYLGEASELMINIEDFFHNFPTLMPGDTYEDTAKLLNRTAVPVGLYFRCEAAAEDGVLDRIALRIGVEEDGRQRIVYEGPLRAANLSEDILLTVLPANKSANLNFMIAVPEGLRNPYAGLREEVRWIFSAAAAAEPVETGDSSQNILWLAVAVISAGGAAFLAFRRHAYGRRH